MDCSTLSHLIDCIARNNKLMKENDRLQAANSNLRYRIIILENALNTILREKENLKETLNTIGAAVNASKV